MSSPTRTEVGRYQLERELGRGGTAVVYAATDRSAGRQVALKLLDRELGAEPDFLTRFRREARTQAALEHPHVVTVYEAGESEYGRYIAMQLVEGPTLARLLHDGELAAARALALLRQVAEALDAANAAGLVHGDVKPQNVLVAKGDHAYLADFGLARRSSSWTTVRDGIFGTPGYLAPEIIAGELPTPASDRYAFAAMLFECLSGAPVFPRGTDIAVIHAHASDPPPAISVCRPELPSALDEPLQTALAKDPDRRPSTATALVAAVARALGAERVASLGPPPMLTRSAAATTAAGPLTQPPGPPRRSRRTVAAALGSALAGSLLTLLAVALLTTGHERVRTDAVPRLPRGGQALGSNLPAATASVSCSGGPSSCTIIQTELPQHALRAPRDGVLRRWMVRGAHGELSLRVFTDRGGGAHQIAVTRSESVGNGGLHVFGANLAIERGDYVGVQLAPDASIGVRGGVRGARSRRWTPPLFGDARPPDRGAGAGDDRELLVRVEYVPGGRRRLPRQLSGPAAARAPAGRGVGRVAVRFRNGRRARAVLVELADRVVLDLFRGDRRIARSDLPGLRPGGRVLFFGTESIPGKDAEVGIPMEYVNADSERIQHHYLLARPLELEFLD